MLMERRIQGILDQVVRNIQVETDVLNLEGIIVASSEKTRIGKREEFLTANAEVEEKERFIFNNRTYMKFHIDKVHAFYLSIEGTNKIIKNYGILIISLIDLYLRSTIQRMDREDIISAGMLGQISDLEFQRGIQEYNIRPEAPRCLLAIRTKGMEAVEIHKILLNVFPRNTDDFLVLINSQTVGLVKTMADGMDEEQIIQLGQAIEDTILNETSIKSYIGIGRPANSIYKIASSYKEAIEAIEIGRMYDPNKTIYFYGTLLLERFLYGIPKDMTKKYSDYIFNEEFAKTLDDEMIATVEKFFENSLNLSETSRQLYIHRNTLVYRLDKIQKVLGLDLRNFHDAVTFQIMMMLDRQN